MDKIMSTRMDEALIRRVGMLAKKMGMSKKAVLENAVRFYAERIEEEDGIDVLYQTCGCWNREESADETWRLARNKMRESQERYKNRK